MPVIHQLEDQRAIPPEDQAGDQAGDRLDDRAGTAVETMPHSVSTWFEACTEHRGPDLDGPCAACGWLDGDHPVDLAEVVAVAPRPAVALRRAS